MRETDTLSLSFPSCEDVPVCPTVRICGRASRDEPGMVQDRDLVIVAFEPFVRSMFYGGRIFAPTDQHPEMPKSRDIVPGSVRER